MQDGIVQSVKRRCVRIALASVGLEIKKNLNDKAFLYPPQMSRPPPPRDPSHLEILASRLPTNNLPNFEKVSSILFDTFVRPDGPALLLVSHYYYTGRGFSKEEPTYDPMEQIRWCRQNLSYFSQLAKFIARLRNKLAHQQHIDPELLMSLARELSNLRPREPTLAIC